jgi:hypothetical protein
MALLRSLQPFVRFAQNHTRPGNNRLHSNRNFSCAMRMAATYARQREVRDRFIGALPAANRLIAACFGRGQLNAWLGA